MAAGKTSLGAYRKRYIKSPPGNLMIMLTRFSNKPVHGAVIDPNTGNVVAARKLMNRLEYPEILDISPWMETKNNVNYKLKQVVLHSGSAGGGHYHSAACETIKGGGDQWWRFNDEHVYKTNIEEILHGKEAKYWTPYILFYEKNGLSIRD